MKTLASQPSPTIRWPRASVLTSAIKTNPTISTPDLASMDARTAAISTQSQPERSFIKTRPPLRKWFLASYLTGHDKRGVSALMISTELALRYEIAWLMCHKIRHALTERDEFRLQDFIEVDETSMAVAFRRAITDAIMAVPKP